MPTDEDIAYLVQRVHERLQFVSKNTNDREILYGRKKEEHLMAVIRQVVEEYYKRFDHIVEEIINRIRSHFP